MTLELVWMMFVELRCVQGTWAYPDSTACEPRQSTDMAVAWNTEEEGEEDEGEETLTADLKAADNKDFLSVITDVGDWYQ